jgi:hypothetical protein
MSRDSDDTPKPEKRPALTYGDARYSYDEDDDEREMMQRECDCIVKHGGELMCICFCHPAPLIKQDTAPGTLRTVYRYVCAECYADNHLACDGRRENGDECECRRCSDMIRRGMN